MLRNSYKKTYLPEFCYTGPTLCNSLFRLLSAVESDVSLSHFQSIQCPLTPAICITVRRHLSFIV